MTFNLVGLFRVGFSWVKLVVGGPSEVPRS